MPSGDSESEDDANRTATKPEDCVRPKPMDTDDLSDVSRYNAENKNYEKCVDRTSKDNSEGGSGGGNGGGGGDGGGSNNDGPGADDTAEADPTAQNENAKQPEECVKPEAPDESSNPDDYYADQQSYDDCLLRTGQDGGGGNGGGENGGGGSTDGASNCKPPDGDEPAPEEMQKYEECLNEEGQLENDDATPGADDSIADASGLAGVGLGVFKKILSWLYDSAVVAPSKQAAEYMADEAFELPDLNSGGILAVYEKVADAIKPGAVPVMIYLGLLMMYRGTDYNAAATAQGSLPKIFIFLIGATFFPDLLKIFSDIGNGLSDIFVSPQSLEQFLTGVMESDTGEESNSLDLAVVAYIVLFLMLLLVGFMTMLKNVAFAVLVVAGPIPMFLWLIPQLSSAAGVWARGIIACLIMPVLFAAEIGIGVALSNVPSAVFGADQATDTHSMFIAIVILYLMWQTPKHLITWAFGAQSGGGLMRTLMLAKMFLPGRGK